MQTFNTEGPVTEAEHYCIPPLQRLDLDELLDLVRLKKYFVLHAPRQTGKTSTLLALADRLNRAGNYRCVYVNVESAQARHEDIAAANRMVVSWIVTRARISLRDHSPHALSAEVLAQVPPGAALNEFLIRWAAASPQPLVLLLAEIDALVRASLISVLRQLREGYDLRPHNFPQSVVLYYREHAEHWLERFAYREAGPQQLLQAFLQRAVNSGGRIDREYALGHGRTDLLVLWPLGGQWDPTRVRKHVVECKVVRAKRSVESTIREGLGQIADYMDRSAADSGHLAVFDRSSAKSWSAPAFRRDEEVGRKRVTVWGM